MSFDTGHQNELKKDEDILKRKIDKGNADSDGTVENKAELLKKKKKPNLKSDLIEKLDAQNSKLMEQMDAQHKDKTRTNGQNA